MGMFDTILNNVHFEKLCRLCISDKGSEINLYQLTNCTNIFTLQDVLNFTSIDINKNDNLPIMICSRCYIILNNTFEYRSFIRKCDSILRDHLNDPSKQLVAPVFPVNKDSNSCIDTDYVEESYKVNTPCESNFGDYTIQDSSQNQEEIADSGDKNINNKEHIVYSPKDIVIKGLRRRKSVKKCADSSNKSSDDIRKKQVRRRKGQAALSYECPVCLKLFSMRCRMEYHLKIHGDKTEPCLICNRKFKHKREVLIHLKTHTGMERFQCEYCAQWYSSSANLCKHIRIKHRTERGLPVPEPRERTHLCHICSKGFYNTTSLKSHLVTHTKDRNYECPVCQKSFISQNYVQKHMIIHNTSLDFTCTVCLKMFTQAKNLKVHMISHTGIKEFVCQICTRAFARKNELKMHTKIHCNEKDIPCPLCPMLFTQVGNMKRHLGTHQDKEGHSPRPRDHLCSVCSKGFTTKELLATHNKTHSVERDYGCDICGARFRTRAILQGHVETHNTVKAFVCEVCSKGFTKDKYLKVHMRSHTKERNFDCSECDRGFATSYLLSLHQKQHKGEFHYYCAPCNKGYMSRPNLDKHLRSKEHLRLHSAPLLPQSEVRNML